MADTALFYQQSPNSGAYQTEMERPQCLDSVMQKLRNKSNQRRTWLETTKALRGSILDKRHQLEATEKAHIHRCLDHLHTAVTVTNLQGMLERLEAITRQVGLKFTAGLSGNDVYISTDMFYMEVHLEPSGLVKDIKVTHHHDGDSTTYPELTKVLSDGDFAEFTEHLEGLADIYRISGDKKQKTKAFLALQSLDNDLNLLAQLQSSISGVSNYIHKSPLGILQPRNGGRPMKLIYFVAPYDLLNEKKKTSYSLTVEAITDNKLGHSMTIGLESSNPHLLQTMPLMTVNKTADGKGLPHFSAPSNLNSCSLPACFVLNLQKPIPVALHVIKKIQSLTGVDFVDLSQVQPLISLLVRDVSKGKVGLAPCINNNNTGHFVTMPDQQHCYFLNGMNGLGDLKAAMVTRIPFTHPTHVPHIIIQLRQQLLFNTVIGSCVRPKAKQDIQKSIMFEVTPLSLQHITVAFEHPLKDSMATAEFDLSDVTNVKCKLCTFDTDESFCTDEYICKVVQRSLSIPVTTRAILRKASSKLNLQHPPITLVLSKVGEQRRQAFVDLTRNHKQLEAHRGNASSASSAPPSSHQAVYSSTYSDITNESYESYTEHRFSDAANLTAADIADALNADKISRNPMLASLLDQDTASPEPQQTSMLSTLLGDEASKLPNPMAMPPKHRKKSLKRKGGSESRSPGSGKSPKRKPSEEDMSRDYAAMDLDSGSGSSPYEVNMHSGSSANTTPGGSTPQHLNMIVNRVEEQITESHVLKLASSVEGLIKQETAKVNCVAKNSVSSRDADVKSTNLPDLSQLAEKNGDSKPNVLPNPKLITSIKKEKPSYNDIANSQSDPRPLDPDMFTNKEGTFTPNDFIGNNSRNKNGARGSYTKYEGGTSSSLDFNTELLNPDTNFTDSLLSADQSEDLDLEVCDANAFGTGMNPAAIVASKLSTGGAADAGSGGGGSSKGDAKSSDHSGGCSSSSSKSQSLSSSKQSLKEKIRENIKREPDTERESSKKEGKELSVKEEKVKEKGALTMKLSTKDFKEPYTKVSKHSDSSTWSNSNESSPEALDLSKRSKEYKIHNKDKSSGDQDSNRDADHHQPPLTTTISVAKPKMVTNSSLNKSGKPLSMAAGLMNQEHVKKYKIQKSEKNKKRSSKHNDDPSYTSSSSSSSSGKRKREEKRDKSSKKKRSSDSHAEFSSSSSSSSHVSIRNDNASERKLGDHMTSTVMKPAPSLKITIGKNQIKQTSSPLRTEAPSSSSSSPSKSSSKSHSSLSSSSSSTFSSSTSSTFSSDSMTKVTTTATTTLATSTTSVTTTTSSSSSSSSGTSKMSTIIKVPSSSSSSSSSSSLLSSSSLVLSSEKDKSSIKNSSSSTSSSSSSVTMSTSSTSSSTSSSSSSSSSKSSVKVSSAKSSSSSGRMKGLSSSQSLSKDTKLNKTPTIKLKPIIIPGGDRATYNVSSTSSRGVASAAASKQTTAPSTPTTPGASLASKSPIKSRKPSLLAVIDKLNNKAGISGIVSASAAGAAAASSPLRSASPYDRKDGAFFDKKDGPRSLTPEIIKKEKDSNGGGGSRAGTKESSAKKESSSSSSSSTSQLSSKRDSVSSSSSSSKSSKADIASATTHKSGSSGTPTRELIKSESGLPHKSSSNARETSQKAQEKTSSSSSSSSKSHDQTSRHSSTPDSLSSTSSSASKSDHKRSSDGKSSSSSSISGSSSNKTSKSSSSSSSGSGVSNATSSSSSSSSSKDNKHSSSSSSGGGGGSHARISSSSSAAASHLSQNAADSSTTKSSSVPNTEGGHRSGESKSAASVSSVSSSSSSSSSTSGKEREKDRSEREKDKGGGTNEGSGTKGEKSNRKSKLEDIADKLQTRRHFTDIMTKINGSKSSSPSSEKRDKSEAQQSSATASSKTTKEKDRESASSSSSSSSSSSTSSRDKYTNGESSSVVNNRSKQSVSSNPAEGASGRSKQSVTAPTADTAGESSAPSALTSTVSSSSSSAVSESSETKTNCNHDSHDGGVSESEEIAGDQVAAATKSSKADSRRDDDMTADTVFKAPTPKSSRPAPRDGSAERTEKLAVAPRSRSESNKSSRQNLSPRSDASSPEDGLVIDCPTTPNHRARSPMSRDADSSPTAGLVIDCPYSSPLTTCSDLNDSGELVLNDADTSGSSGKSMVALTSPPPQKSPVVRLSPVHSPSKSPLPKSTTSSLSNHSPCSIDDDLMDEALMGFGQ